MNKKIYEKVRPSAWHLTGASIMLVLFPLLVQEVEQMDIVKYMNRYMNYFQHKNSYISYDRVAWQAIKIVCSAIMVKTKSSKLKWKNFKRKQSFEVTTKPVNVEMRYYAREIEFSSGKCSTGRILMKGFKLNTYTLWDVFNRWSCSCKYRHFLSYVIILKVIYLFKHVFI